MATVLVTARPDQTDLRQAQDRDPAPAGSVDFVTDDLASFLRRVNDRLDAFAAWGAAASG